MCIDIFTVTRLMGGSGTGSMSHMTNMSSLAACSVSDSKPMQFPLTQRRKRRVLFTQAQVSVLLPIIVINTSVNLFKSSKISKQKKHAL